MRTGLIHIYYGDGKGKTTCGMGLCVRAAGAGLKVLVFQFLKDNDTSELRILEQIPNIVIEKGLDHVKFTFLMNEAEKNEAKEFYTDAFRRITKRALNEEFDLLFLDEILHAVNNQIINEKELIEFLENKPQKLEVVINGYFPSEELLSLADYVSHIQKEKHPFDKKIPQRLGIEK